MASRQTTRFLFLDDSGHPAPNYATGAVIIGGFSVASGDVAAINRRLAGAKGGIFPERGQPSRWEVKAAHMIRPHLWKRPRNQQLAGEIISILRGLGCTVYTASISKARMHHRMTQRTTMPLQLQALIEHFAVECAVHLAVGAIVMDRSNHPIDAHASHCAASYVVSQDLPLHPTVYYADSVTSQPVQIADLISGVRRRALEGDTSLRSIDTSFGALRPDTYHWPPTHTGRRWTNRITLF